MSHIEDNSESTRFIVPKRDKSMSATASSNPVNANMMLPRRAISPIHLVKPEQNNNTYQNPPPSSVKSVNVETSTKQNLMYNTNPPPSGHIEHSTLRPDNMSGGGGSGGGGGRWGEAPPMPPSVTRRQIAPGGRTTGVTPGSHIITAPSPAGGAIRSAAVERNRYQNPTSSAQAYVTPAPPTNRHTAQDFGTYSNGQQTAPVASYNQPNTTAYGGGYTNPQYNQQPHPNQAYGGGYNPQYPHGYGGYQYPPQGYYQQPPPAIPEAPATSRPNYSAMTESEKSESRRRLIDKISILQRKFPKWNIKPPPDSVSLNYLHDVYENYVIQIRSHSNATQYKIGLVISIVLIELVFTYIVKFDISGYAMNQITHMYRYEDVLLEIGEKYSGTGGGEPWSPEVRLVFVVLSQTVVFVIAKLISDWTGSSDIPRVIHEIFDGMMGGDDGPGASGLDSDGIPVAPGTEDDIAAADLGEGISNAAGQAAASRSGNVPGTSRPPAVNIGSVIGSLMGGGGGDGGGLNMGKFAEVAMSFMGGGGAQGLFNGGGKSSTSPSSKGAPRPSPAPRPAASPVRSPPVFNE